MKITLANLTQATEQQIFDQVAAHLLTQKKRSATPFGGCKYRYSGLMCAAGCLISDEEYSTSFEVTSWVRLALTEKVPKVHKEFIQSLQGIHDQQRVDRWFWELKRFAYARNLNFDEAKYKTLWEGA